MTETANSLRSRLSYEPQELQFGTSGRRGEVVHLTQLEIYINALAELQYLEAIPASSGGIVRGDDFYFASDLRPSSTQYVQEERGCGEICQAVECAIRDAGMRPIYLAHIRPRLWRTMPWRVPRAALWSPEATFHSTETDTN